MSANLKLSEKQEVKKELVSGDRARVQLPSVWRLRLGAAKRASESCSVRSGWCSGKQIF